MTSISNMDNSQYLKAIVIEDNDVDREMLLSSLTDYPFIHIKGSFSNPVESLETLNYGGIDLVFSDIDMPGISGIDFLKSLPHPPLCIFTTVHPEFAIDAFDVQAVDYVMKPIREERLEKAIQRAIELLEIKKKALKYEMDFEQDAIMIKEGTVSSKVLIRNISYLEALTNYTKVVTKEKSYITLQNLKNFMDFLPKDKFIRIHRSYAIALDKLDEVGIAEVVVNGHRLPVGKTYRSLIRNINRS